MSENENTQNIEENLPMVNYIMLHRIYDVLMLIANMSSKTDEDRHQIIKMVEYHKQGYLLGPSPAYISGENNDTEQK